MVNQSKTLLSLGDMLRAFGHLQPADERTQQAIVAFLSMQEQSQPQMPPVSVAPPAPTLPPLNPPPVEEEPFPETPPPPQLTAPLSSVLEKEATTPLTTHPVITPLPDEPSLRQPPPHPEPLFFPPWRRSILSTALATWSDDGLPNIHALLKRLVLMRPVEHLPRLSGPTLRQGVQILVDHSETLIPFRFDQEDLVQAIIHLVGSDKVSVQEFIGSPMRGVSDPDLGWYPYHPPPAGTVVVLLTDLGIGETLFAPRLTSPEEWLLFNTMLRRVGCPVVAFVPYAARRWPPVLAHALKIVFWDRSTTVSTVYHMRGASRRQVYE